MDRETLNSTYKKFQQIVRDHFRNEEKSFLKHSYNFKEDHPKNHNYLKNKLDKFAIICENQTQTVVSDFLVFIDRWLEEHIAEFDDDFLSYTK